jgi:hypothetical protein
MNTEEEKFEKEVKEFTEIWDKQVFPYIKGLTKKVEEIIEKSNIQNNCSNDDSRLVTFNCDKPNEFHYQLIWIEFSPDNRDIVGIRQITYTNKYVGKERSTKTTIVYIEELFPNHYSHNYGFYDGWPDESDLNAQISWLYFMVNDLPWDINDFGRF